VQVHNKCIPILLIRRPGACIIKLYTEALNFVMNYASVFVIATNFLFALTNTLAFNVTELITAIKSFIGWAPGDNVIKLFMVVSYEFL
jgi:hypothetical protein